MILQGILVTTYDFTKHFFATYDFTIHILLQLMILQYIFVATYDFTRNFSYNL